MGITWLQFLEGSKLARLRKDEIEYATIGEEFSSRPATVTIQVTVRMRSGAVHIVNCHDGPTARALFQDATGEPTDWRSSEERP